MPRTAYWNPKVADEVVMSEAMRRLELAGETLAGAIKDKLKSVIKDPYYSRPVYKTGKHAGKWWTARDAGELLKSVRVVKKYDSIHRNILIICGHSKAYYAAMFEYAATPARGVPFFRPALSSSRRHMKRILENG